MFSSLKNKTDITTFISKLKFKCSWFDLGVRQKTETFFISFCSVHFMPFHMCLKCHMEVVRLLLSQCISCCFLLPLCFCLSVCVVRCGLQFSFHLSECLTTFSSFTINWCSIKHGLWLCNFTHVIFFPLCHPPPAMSAPFLYFLDHQPCTTSATGSLICSAQSHWC